MFNQRFSIFLKFSVKYISNLQRNDYLNKKIVSCFCQKGHSPNKSLYQILGLQKSATSDQIRAKYYELAKQYHPDTSPGSEDKFKQIYNAYQILGNTLKREEYDKQFNDRFGKQKQQYQNDGFGPYDPSKMNKQGQRAYYNYSQPQWSRTRRGIRPQSYTSYYSQKVMEMGPNDDSTIQFFKRKNTQLNFMKEEQRKQSIEQMKKIREIYKIMEQQSERKHRQRIKKAQIEQRRKILQKLERKWYGGFFQGLFAKLIGRGKYDGRDEKSDKTQDKEQTKKFIGEKDKK